MTHPFDVKDRLGASVLLYGYGVALGAAYLFAFWRPLGFNIFPFLSPTDFLTIPFNRLSILLAPLVLLLLLQFGESPTRPHKEHSHLLFHLIVIHILYSLAELFRAAPLIFNPGYVYENEKSIFAISLLFLTVSGALAYRFKNDNAQRIYPLLAIVFAQLAMVLATGYRDGKTLYEGAADVFFLDQPNACGAPSRGSWVYLDKYGGNVFFLGSVDKRLCISDEMNFKLVSRNFVEGPAR